MCKRCCVPLLLIVGSLAIVGVPAASQERVQAGTSAPAVDDPGLYLGLFSFQQILRKDAAGDRANGDGLLRAVVRDYHISDADFAALGKVADAVLAKLPPIHAAAKAYSSSEVAAGRMPDRAKIEEFQRQEADIVRGGMRDLEAALSPEGWRNLHAYINGAYRLTVVRKEQIRAK